ncbi:MAG: LptA/OstA family protein [Planctomycetaceae bacterium]|jgi:lipopolysaccharide export system protein LptA|nr:LptA/OstA family protein [Planctomycetaceae bacterium]
MSRRFYFAFYSFLVVFACYLLCAFAAVPVLMPSRVGVVQPTSAFGGSEIHESYTKFLPADYWEHDKENRILRTDDTVIIFKEWEWLDDKTRIKVYPCTIMMLQGDTELPFDERCRQAIVIRTADHALVELDNEFGFGGSTVPNITKGTLVGNVTFYSDMKETSPDDDLYIKGRDITFSESKAATTVSSIHDIELILGNNRCFGSKLNIVMSVKAPKNPEGQKSLSQIELIEMKSLRIVTNDSFTKQSSEKNVSDKTTTKQSTIDITCKRNFSLVPDVQFPNNWLANFNEDVVVVNNNPDGTRDTIDCGKLQILLQPRRKTDNGNANAAADDGFNDPSEVGNYEVAAIRALYKPEETGQSTGVVRRATTPARLQSPSRDFIAEGEEIRYDMVNNYIQISKTLFYKVDKPSGLTPAHLACPQKGYYLDAEQVVYVLPKEGETFGKLTAVNGRMGGKVGGGANVANTQKFACSWDRLTVSPDPKTANGLIVFLENNTFRSDELKRNRQVFKESKINAELEATGKMTANSACFWCLLKPQTNDAGNVTDAAVPQKSDLFSSGNIIIDRAQVLGGVHFQTVKGNCEVRQLDMTFTYIGNEKPNNSEPLMSTLRPVKYQYPPNLPNANSSQTAPGAVQPSQPRMTPIGAAPAVATSQPLSVPITNNPANPVSRAADLQGERGFLFNQTGNGTNPPFELKADHLKLSVVITPANTHIAKIDIYGVVKDNISYEVAIKEIVPTGDTSAIEIKGSEIHITDPILDTANAASNEMTVKVIGNGQTNAEFSGKGVQLIGKEINFVRSSNLLWVKGGGQLTVHVPSGGTSSSFGSMFSLQNQTQNQTVQPPQQPNSKQVDKLFVMWNQEMTFNGEILSFKGKRDYQGLMVKVFFQNNEISAEAISLYLNRFFSFFDNKTNDELSAKTIVCDGAVVLTSHSYKDNGITQKSRDEAQCERLTVQVTTGEFRAMGPGKICSTYLDDSESSMMLPTVVGTSVIGNGETKADSLRNIDIRFHDQVTGNFANREATLSGQIFCVVCPVSSWSERVNADNLSEIAKRGILMQCNQLRVAQTSDGNVELTAAKNTSIEGNEYYARADSFKYNQSKGLVILDGNATTDATLHSERGSVSGGRIEYNIETGAYNTTGLKIY